MLAADRDHELQIEARRPCGRQVDIRRPYLTLDIRPPSLKFLARPEAATKANDSVAARDQHSAFSRQLLNQDSEHAFDFHGLR